MANPIANDELSQEEIANIAKETMESFKINKLDVSKLIFTASVWAPLVDVQSKIVNLKSYRFGNVTGAKLWEECSQFSIRLKDILEI